jgi:sugar phosphate isomerase/epimerase
MSETTKPLPIAFSTLGCPKWDWKTVLRQAENMGYTAIELRGLYGQLDLTACPEFIGTRLQQSQREIQAHNLRIIGLGASAQLHEHDPAARAAHLDEARRMIDLAYQLEARYVRVFPNRMPPDQPRQATIERIVTGLRLLGEYAKASGVTVILESHGDVTDSATLLEIMQGVELQNVGLLWDICNMFVAHQEKPADVFQRLASYIRHTHVKDCKRQGEAVQYVLLGEGIVPLRDALDGLTAGNYDGFYSFEWEKLWHPAIEEPEIALPHFVKVMRTYLEEAARR